MKTIEPHIEPGDEETGDVLVFDSREDMDTWIEQQLQPKSEDK